VERHILDRLDPVLLELEHHGEVLHIGCSVCVVAWRPLRASPVIRVDGVAETVAKHVEAHDADQHGDHRREHPGIGAEVCKF